MNRCTLLLASSLLVAACDPNGGTDAGSCPMDVTLGTMETGSFEPLADNDPVEMLLGFQGFRMLRFGVRARGAEASNVEIGAYLAVPESGVEVSQQSREREVVSETGGFLVEEYLLFFNDQPPAVLVGYDANLELTVRSAGCLGGQTLAVEIRDDDPCVDHGIVLDAATRPDAPDGGTTCD